jgi:hypothetical protein
MLISELRVLAKLDQKAAQAPGSSEMGVKAKPAIVRSSTLLTLGFSMRR